MVQARSKREAGASTAPTLRAVPRTCDLRPQSPRTHPPDYVRESDTQGEALCAAGLDTIWPWWYTATMRVQPRSPEETYAPAWEQVQAAFPDLSPEATARRAAVRYHSLVPAQGWFEVPFLTALYQVHWPDAAVSQFGREDDVPIAIRLVLAHYLLTADGVPRASRWITFREVPGGLGYWAAFQGRSSLRLARRFGSDQEGFARAAEALGGEALAFGDAAYAFRVLPRVWMAAVLHLGDEEFGANVTILFDAVVSHYLPTEDLAVLGGMLASRLIDAARA
jgi:hypothetical protein